jgi:hypothetical protein
MLISAITDDYLGRIFFLFSNAIFEDRGFPSPLTESDVRSYHIQLSDWLHLKVHAIADAK